MAATSAHKRRDMDIMKLMMSDYVVDMEGDGSGFVVQFHGPKDSLYEGGIWRVQVALPKDYPYRSPSIGFKNRLFHPNVDEMSGSVCLDVINQTWSPMYELVNIFEMFLPQLLAYPNASDPLNSEAAALMIQDYDKYALKVKDYVRKFASNDGLGDLPSTIKKNRHPSTDSASTVRSAASSSTYASSASSATMTSQHDASSDDDDSMMVDLADASSRDRAAADFPSGPALDAQGNQDQDDDLSSLSDGSDDEDDLVLDL